jgi:hypothetical protein
LETATHSPSTTRLRVPPTRGGFAAAFRLRPRSLATSRLRRLTIAGALALGLAAVFAQPAGQAQSQDPLPYAGGYLITGDYAVGGVDVSGSAVDGFVTGTIPMSGVPADAEIIDAVLYWETITTQADISQAAGVQFRGVDIDIHDTWTVKKYSQDLTGQTASCWSSGSPLMMTMFRAHVLHYLPEQTDANGAPTGKRLVNDLDLLANELPLNTVRLPKFGTGNQVPESAGASLVVVYTDKTTPLRKVVVYDGIYVNPPGETMSQTLQGFYKSAQIKSARLTHIAASGQKNPTERLYFNGSRIATNPFPDSSNAASERAWANPTFNLTESLMSKTTNSAQYGETATTAVDHQKTSPYECLTWGAVVFSTAVADVDNDGIPDGLEDALTPLKDPGMGPDEYLPDLNAMGASSARKDVFIEINAMRAAPGTTYGSGDDQKTDLDGHTHMPSPEVLEMVGRALKNAPVANPDGSYGIRAHFDVGNIDPGGPYRSLGVVHRADWVSDYTSTEADEYLVPSHLARGGEIIEERKCVPSETVTCLFPDYAGVVGWKLGAEALKYAPVGDDGEELTAAQMDGWLSGQTQRRRFDLSRAGLFHYLLYAHARGTPRSLFPCLDGDGKPAPYDLLDGTSCTTHNPDLRKPTSASGIADLPGITALITLGLWDDFLGRPFIQASTTLHELGHNFGLGHGGFGPTWGNSLLNTTNYFEPNCKSNYLSSMNYKFQAHGLVDDLGNQHLDYSRDAYPEIDETKPLPGVLQCPVSLSPGVVRPARAGYAGIQPRRDAGSPVLPRFSVPRPAARGLGSDGSA